MVFVSGAWNRESNSGNTSSNSVPKVADPSGPSMNSTYENSQQFDPQSQQERSFYEQHQNSTNSYDHSQQNINSFDPRLQNSTSFDQQNSNSFDPSHQVINPNESRQYNNQFYEPENGFYDQNGHRIISRENSQQRHRPGVHDKEFHEPNLEYSQRGFNSNEEFARNVQKFSNNPNFQNRTNEFSQNNERNPGYNYEANRQDFEAGNPGKQPYGHRELGHSASLPHGVNQPRPNHHSGNHQSNHSMFTRDPSQLQVNCDVASSFEFL